MVEKIQAYLAILLACLHQDNRYLIGQDGANKLNTSKVKGNKK